MIHSGKRYYEDSNDYDLVQSIAEDRLYSKPIRIEGIEGNRMVYEYEEELVLDYVDEIEFIRDVFNGHDIFEDGCTFDDGDDVYNLFAELLVEFDENKHSLVQGV